MNDRLEGRRVANDVRNDEGEFSGIAFLALHPNAVVDGRDRVRRADLGRDGEMYGGEAG